MIHGTVENRLSVSHALVQLPGRSFPQQSGEVDLHTTDEIEDPPKLHSTSRMKGTLHGASSAFLKPPQIPHTLPSAYPLNTDIQVGC